MSDKDLTNLPILDDIILPGEADKAVHNASSKVQSSLWDGGDGDTPDAPLTDAQAEMDTEIPEVFQPSTEHPVTDQPDTDILDTVDAPPSAEVQKLPLADAAALSDAPAGTLNEQASTATHELDLEALTDEILDNLMLDMEQRIREIIRQTLRRHLPGKIDTD